jgi:diguanylate cyclase (GGDEF)-like protein
MEQRQEVARAPSDTGKRSAGGVILPDGQGFQGLYALALDKIKQGLCVFGPDQRLLLFNRLFAEMYNIAPEDLWLGMSLRDVIDLRYAAGTGPSMPKEDFAVWREQVVGSDRVVETVVELSNGSVHEIHHAPTPDGGWVATFDDITERRRTQQRMHHMASHDPLTDLPNRHVFRERLEMALARTRRGDKLAVLCLDLDRFKAVNDTLGHGVGDALLCSVAQRIKRCLRDGDTVTRLGGDEFAILQLGVAQAADAAKLAGRIIASVAKPHNLEGRPVSVGTSVGVALAPTDSDEPGSLMKNADLAMYRAKKEGGGRHRFFESVRAAA